MSSKWVQDIANMHQKYGVHTWMSRKVIDSDYDTLKKYIEFRVKFLQEELTETQKAVENGDAEEIVDGLIDLCVVAIGTLDAFGVEADAAWDRVHKANMSKEVGVKESRPNPLGLPDLIKPEGWEPPDHSGNHGYFPTIYKK